MQIEYVGRDFELDDEIREFAAQRLRKLERFLQEPATAHLVLAVQKHFQRAELHVSHRHGDLRAAIRPGVSGNRKPLMKRISCNISGG